MTTLLSPPRKKAKMTTTSSKSTRRRRLTSKSSGSSCHPMKMISLPSSSALSPLVSSLSSASRDGASMVNSTTTLKHLRSGTTSWAAPGKSPIPSSSTPSPGLVSIPSTRTKPTRFKKFSAARTTKPRSSSRDSSLFWKSTGATDSSTSTFSFTSV